MIWKRALTHTALRQKVVGRTTSLITPRAFSTVLGAEDTTASSTRMFAAAAVAGLVSGSAAWALCEHEKHQHHYRDYHDRKIKFERSYSKGGIRDPMTIYAQYALEREIKEAEEKDVVATAEEEEEEQKDETPMHATSPLDPGDRRLDLAASGELTPSEQKIEEATRKAKQHSGGLKVFSGNGNMALSLEIARHLGINLGRATVGRFADGEVNCVIQENVRGKDVYIVQPTCPPVNDNLMELLLMVSTLRRASARRITVVIPYYGYARQDRKMQVGLQACFVHLLL